MGTGSASPLPLPVYLSRRSTRGTRPKLVALACFLAANFFFLLSASSPPPAPPIAAWNVGQRLWRQLALGDQLAFNDQLALSDQLDHEQQHSYDWFLDDPAEQVVHPQTEYEGCDGWDPSGTAAQDPPGCLRARQYRQIQAWYAKRDKYPYDAETFAGVRQLERCVLGLNACPTRPLIISSWWYTYRGMRGGVSGEEFWMGEVVEAVQEDGFIVISGFQVARMHQLVKDLHESLHMYWLRDTNAFQCAQDPRCVRPEDYTPTDDPAIGYDVADIAARGELGVLPLFRIFAVSYWGARAVHVPAPGLNAQHSWGVEERPGGNEVWSYNPLGRQWIVTPYPYPGHTWVPFSAERECLQNPHVPSHERDSTVVILAKQTEYFDRDVARELRPEWPALASELAEQNHSLVSTSKLDRGHPLPAGIVQLGMQQRAEYQGLVGHAKALVGIGNPVISPSPYVALCMGTPVIMPYAGESEPDDPWEMYNTAHAQHGPINALKEPYVYTYDIRNASDLRDKVMRAIQTPIKPYVPPGYDEKAVKLQTRKMLYYDYEGEYGRVLAANGGRPPALPIEQIRRCWENGWCSNSSYVDNLQP